MQSGLGGRVTLDFRHRGMDSSPRNAAVTPYNSVLTYQAVEKRDLRRWASSFVIAAYGLYASFPRIRPPCITSFFTSLPAMLFINGRLWDRALRW